MRRSDRLFDIIQRLRTTTKPTTAAALAAGLEVTPRTVYRDIATLQARYSRHTAGAIRWDDPVALEADNQLNGNAGNDASPELGIDAAGNVMVIWRKQATSGLVDVWSRRVTAAGVLENPSLIENQNDYSAFGHQLAVAPNGVAVAVWFYATVGNIWAAVFR